MATDKLFAPPTKEELFAPPKPEERADMFAPPSQEELFAAPTQKELFAAPSEQELGVAPKTEEVPDVIREKELEQIAKKYNVDKEFLRESAPFLLTNVELKSILDLPVNTAKYASGLLLDTVGFGIPQKVRIESEEDPNKRQALQELRDLGEQQRSLLNKIALGVAAPGILASAAKGTGTLGQIVRPLTETAVGRFATAATAGAAGGFGYSKEGEELKGIKEGATFGAAIGGGVEGLGLAIKGLGKIASVFSKEGRAASEAERAALRDLEPDLQRVQEEATNRIDSKPSSILLQDYVTGTKNIDDMSVNDAMRIVENELDPKATQAYLNINSKRGIEAYKDLDETIVRELGHERAITLKLAKDVVNQQRSSFLEQVMNKKITDPELLEEAIQDLSRQKMIRSQYRDYRIGQEMDAMIEAKSIHNVNPQSKLGEVFSKLSDAVFTLRVIDEKFKTPLEISLAKLAKRRNLMSNVTLVNTKILDSIYDFAEKNGTVQAAKSGKIFDAIDQGKLDSLSDAEKQTAEKIVKEFQRLYKFITSGIEKEGITGLKIPQVKDYVARMAMGVPETIAKVEMEVNTALTQANKALGTNYKNLNQLSGTDFVEVENLPAFRNLKYYIQWVKGLPEPIKFNSASDLSRVINESLRSETDIKMLDRVARGSMERTAEVGGIPDFIKEKDVFNVLSRYSHDMLSTLYQREPLQEMRFIADRLKAAKAHSEAQYVYDLIEDTWGVRKGTVAHYMRDVKGHIARKLDPKIADAIARGDNTSAFVLNSVKEMQDLPGYLAGRIYDNVLGWNPVPITQNLISGVARTAPELGTQYGYTTYFRGLIYTAANFKSLINEVRATGLVPAEFTRNGQRAIANGIRASKMVDATVKGFDYLGKLGMILYEASENINRAQILAMSRIMAHDLTTGSKLARGALEKFPTQWRQAVLRAGNDPKAIERIIAMHLNQTTAFNYQRPSLWQYGRSLGPMFSTFSKWPTALGGELGAEIRIKGLPRGLARSAERYAIPLIGLGVADHYLKERLEESERMQAVLGKRGVSKAAPIASLTGFAAGDIFTPPMIDTIMQDFVIPITKGEGGKLVKGMDRAAFTYMPGAGFVKFLTDFVPTVITGERPEGSTRTERTIEGAKELKKIID